MIDVNITDEAYMRQSNEYDSPARSNLNRSKLEFEENLASLKKELDKALNKRK